jgi:hypothetical protein
MRLSLVFAVILLGLNGCRSYPPYWYLLSGYNPIFGGKSCTPMWGHPFVTLDGCQHRRSLLQKDVKKLLPLRKGQISSELFANAERSFKYLACRQAASLDQAWRAVIQSSVRMSDNRPPKRRRLHVRSQKGEVPMKRNGTSLPTLLAATVLATTVQHANCAERSSGAAPSAVAPVANPCPRLAAGAQVENPPALFTHNGALTVNFSYQTTIDADGRTLFCFMRPNGLENPTLYVHPGDRLIINVTNNTPPAPVEMAIDPPNCGAAEMTASGRRDPYGRQFGSDLHLL